MENKSIIDVEHHFLLYGTTIHLQNVSTGFDSNLFGQLAEDMILYKDQ